MPRCIKKFARQMSGSQVLRVVFISTAVSLLSLWKNDHISKYPTKALNAAFTFLASYNDRVSVSLIVPPFICFLKCLSAASEEADVGKMWKI